MADNHFFDVVSEINHAEMHNAIVQAQHELAVRLMQSRRFPSWGYEVVNGATSIWERWNSFTKDSGFGDASMNSFSHYSFGAVSESGPRAPTNTSRSRSRRWR